MDGEIYIYLYFLSSYEDMLTDFRERKMEEEHFIIKIKILKTYEKQMI